MILVLSNGANEVQRREVFDELERLGMKWNELDVLGNPLVHIVDGHSREARAVQSMEAVQGLVPTPGPRIRARGRYFFPYHLINWISLLLIVLGALIVLAGFFPPSVSGEIDRAGSIADAALPWYLNAPHALVAYGPLGVLALVGGALLLFFLPQLDRFRRGSGAPRALVLVASAVLAAAWVFLTVVQP